MASYYDCFLIINFVGVYLSLNDVIVPNHGYVLISDIGSVGDDTALICHTDRPATLGSSYHPHSGGNWFAPDNTRVNWLDVPGFTRNRGPMIVRLWRYTDTDPPSEGIYQCLVQDDTFTLQTVYVGLYSSEGGTKIECNYYVYHILFAHHFLLGGITISDDMVFTVDSDLNGASPQFTLTCISTGGPATTVTWTRDSDTVTEGTETVLDDQVTAQYTHTLTVTGRLGGLYTCTVANDNSPEEFANYTVLGS